jgi:hypothetical protein
VYQQTGVVRLFADHAFEPVDIDFDRALLVDSVSITVLGQDIAVYDYDVVTTDGDLTVETTR